MKNYISKIYSLPWGCSRIHILNFLMKHSYIKKWSLSKTKTFCRNTLISINVSWVKVLQVQRQRTQPSNCNGVGDTYLRYGNCWSGAYIALVIDSIELWAIVKCVLPSLKVCWLSGECLPLHASLEGFHLLNSVLINYWSGNMLNMLSVE